MDKQVIEKIALEVANGLEEEGFSGTGMDYTNAFAPRFLSRIDAERGKNAAAWVDTLDTARPRCITNLDYRSVTEAKLGVEYVPLFLSPTPTIPDGYVLVPIEPTEEMLIEGRRADKDWCEVETDINVFESGLVAIYKAMIAAAQGERNE